MHWPHLASAAWSISHTDRPASLFNHLCALLGSLLECLVSQQVDAYSSIFFAFHCVYGLSLHDCCGSIYAGSANPDKQVWLHCQVILEEFGKYINLTTGADMAQRDQYYGIIFDEINKLTDAGKPIKVS